VSTLIATHHIAHGVQPVHYLPIATTLISAAFLVLLLRRASQRDWAPHLMWWAVGVFFYGLGTALESAITLGGNTVLLNRLWYVAGAILGGYPLATGTVYLLCRRRLAHALTTASLAFVIVCSVLVFASPMNAAALAADPYRPGGTYLTWQWVRLMTPFINSYAALFLIGGALYSSTRFIASGTAPRRAAGTALIAAGALLPGIGGSMAKAGLVEGLYVGELVGLMLIWAGYEFCIREKAPQLASAVAAEREAMGQRL